MRGVSTAIRGAILAGVLVGALVGPIATSSALVMPTDDVYGWVTDTQSGDPIAGVAAQLYYYAGSSYLLEDSTITGKTGRYGFPGLTAGTDRALRLSHDRYRSTFVYPQRYEGTPVRYDVTLRPRVEGLWGANRYSSAVAIAYRYNNIGGGIPAPDSLHVVIASGEDRASADPLAAAGLCWTYDAPLLLVNSRYVPSEVTQIVSTMKARNGPLTIHIVGGTTSVPDARFTELNNAVGGGLTKDRIAISGSRYDLAAAIAARMKAVAAVTPAKPLPPEAFVANGADPSKFFDALALSPISATRGVPILLVKANEIPGATQTALSSLNPDEVIVGGGPNTVSKTVFNTLDAQFGADRWWGTNRYTTAIDIAEEALAEGMLEPGCIGVAAKLPDALAGGATIGSLRGPLVITNGTTLTPETESFLERWDADNDLAAFALGGPNSLSESVRQDMITALVH